VNRYWLAGIVAVVTTVLDHATKLWAVRVLRPHGRPMEVIAGFFNLRYTENTGSAFGLFQGQSGILTVIGLAALAFVAYLLYRNPKARHRSVVALGLILGGAIGNILDRIIRGYVVDFVDWYAGSFLWPAFNIADAALVAGVIMILIWPEKVVTPEPKSES
jgi:signal peptidase II